MFAQVLTELTFSPGQSRSFTQVWDQILDDGTVAAPGEYEALGSVPVSLPGTASGPVKLTIRAAADSP